MLGLQGRIKTIPKNFRHSTILYVGEGLSSTFYNWGEILLKAYNKPRTLSNADKIIQVKKKIKNIKNINNINKLILI